MSTPQHPPLRAQDFVPSKGHCCLVIMEAEQAVSSCCWSFSPVPDGYDAIQVYNYNIVTCKNAIHRGLIYGKEGIYHKHGPWETKGEAIDAARRTWKAMKPTEHLKGCEQA